MLEVSPIIVGVIIAYLCFIVGNGFFQSWRQRKKGAQGFMLGGKSLGPWVLSMSEKASESSGFMTMGLPGEAATIGFSASWNAVVSYFSVFNWIFMAKPLRRITEIFNSLTVTDYLEKRFRDEERHTIRYVGVIVLMVFEVVYVMVQYIALAKILQLLLGLNYTVAVLIGVVISVSYTMMGGFSAVATNDFIQGMVLFFGLGITPLLMLRRLGGLTSVSEQLIAANGEAYLLPYFGEMSLNSMSTFVLIMAYVMIGVGLVGSPHIIVRYMATKNTRDIRKMAIIGAVWMAISYYGAVSIGMMGSLIVPDISDPENIMMACAIELFHPILAGLIISASCAAILSSVDSMLLIASSTLGEDYFNCIRANGKMSDTQVVKVTRICTVVLGLLGGIMALFPLDSIFWLAVFAWAGLATCFGPPVMFSLYWRKTTRQGVVAGMIVGPVITILWYFTLKEATGIYEGGPAFILSLLAVWIVSLLTQKNGVPPIDKEWDAFNKKSPVGTPMPLPSEISSVKEALSKADLTETTKNDIVSRLLVSNMITASPCEIRM